ncbi:MAG: OPT/YSL family transporter, partial [Proteobacteria bacterium]|nr:OPT/YSL family transporter [Pseudomonadota bacterium]
MLENNALTTVASGAGYMTGGGNMAAFGALMMITTIRPNTMSMIVWFALIAALGVFAAIPIKRQLINREALAFPTGTATAETLTSIHGAASGAGMAKVAALGVAALLGGSLAMLRDGFKLIPGAISLPLSIGGHKLIAWTLALKMEVVLLGGGALMSFRTGVSLLVGAIFTYGYLAPSLVEQKLVAEVSYKAIVGWTVWPGAAVLVGAGLTSFVLDFRSLARALVGITRLFGKHRASAPTDGIAAVETPDWWFPAGFVVLSPIVVALMSILFHIPVWAAIIAIPLAVVMGFVAARVTGETDVTPTKALGPVTQIIYGAMTPGNLTGNIMSANVT